MRLLVAVCLLSCAPLAHAQDYVVHSFDRVQLSDVFYGEGASFGDLNNDGHADVVSGPFWYAGPDFKDRFEYYKPAPFNKNGYSDNFFAFVDDVNGDKWNDIVIIGFPGKEAFWYENPQGQAGHWPKHLAHPVVDNESPHFTDITGDGKPELVFHTGGRFGWAGPDPNDPTKPWEFHAVTPDLKYQRFTHGMGVGDVNGDGKLDILEKSGWWEHGEITADKPTWTFHKFSFSGPGGAQMYAYDFDGDGDNDVVTSLAAHAYGLNWYEQVKDGDKIDFKPHRILGDKPEHSPYGIVFSQLHAIDLVDMDGDGVKDIVTGKRHWAHNGHDVDGNGVPVSYWFRTVRGLAGVEFVPYRIDDASGVGTQVVVGDITGDKTPDLVIGNKLGTFLLIHHADKVSKDVYERSQPQRVAAAPSIETITPAVGKLPANWPQGVAATKPDGSPLNLDLETGDLTDWTATGTAFAKQPNEGDVVNARRGDMHSRHVGRFWIGTYEVAKDPPTGRLTSAVGKITHPWASFLIAGGPQPETRVEIVLKEGDQVIFKASSPAQQEELTAVTVDLTKHVGKEFYVRIVDEHTGHWGHVNYDHFRFHEEKPVFPAGFAVTESVPEGPQHAGLDPEGAVKAMTLPPGFRAIAAASEPDVRQPIAMALDDRGRVWVAEAYCYPIRRPEAEANDQILIFEDTNGDGKFDSRKVFADKLNLVSGFEIGFGGVWVGAAPHLLFIPDKDGDDQPDGPPQVLLDGWGFQDTHETLNAFIWGPDGWLYGCHGVFTHSRVGKPGTPDDQRIPINAGIWRYHPTKHVFEVFAEGTSNPWGVDFDDRGQSFLTCCVIPHLFHVIQHARYQRQAGQHFNQFTYDDIKTIARHRHWTGNQWNNNDRLKSDNLGGGHAHAGAMIYLGDAWPAKYRNELFMNNIHGARLNQDHLYRKGSGFEGDFAPDFLLANDAWSQIINLRYGPDGQVWVIDWYDAQQCHRRELDQHDRGNGRIYKIVHGDPKPVKVDLKKLSDLELAELQLHNNDWYVRHSRRILAERGKIADDAVKRLNEIAFEHEAATKRLRGMWALHVTGNLTPELATRATFDRDEYVRGWAIQLALESGPTPRNFLGTLQVLAARDPSPVVRLYLASAANRLPLEQRWDILAGLLKHSEDAGDHNLPLMYWYAMEPLAGSDMDKALALVETSAIPLVKQFTLRRVAETGSPEAMETLVKALGKQTTDESRLDYLNAISTALKGRRSFEMPQSWKSVSETLAMSTNGEVKIRARALGVTFADEKALAETRSILTAKDAPLPQRQAALESLLGAKDPGLAPTLQSLIGDAELRREALRGLAAYADPKTPDLILKAYGEFSADEKRDALNTLASRDKFALAMLGAVKTKSIDSKDLSADIVRQLSNLKNAEIDKLIGDVWGIVRATPEEKKKLIANYQKLIAAKGTEPDPMLGRAVFAKNCQQCHKLFETGGDVGPELTGSNRANLDYLLSNVLDPSAVMAKDYQPAIVVTDDGRTVTGIVKGENDTAVTLRTANETVIIPKNEIEILKKSDQSMMPDNLWAKLSDHEVRSLVAYLASRGQVPLKATPDTVTAFFNGKDLTGWNGNRELWSVQDGVIVGHTETGLKKNEFLYSDLVVDDFELTLKVRLTPNTENSGIQFRSEMHPDGHAKGYQADIGQGWWGKLYHEHGRALLWNQPGDQHVKTGEWNEYRIRAQGHKIQTWINGQLCVDLDDPEGELSGIIAVQLHSGGPMKVEFKDLELKVAE